MYKKGGPTHIYNSCVYTNLVGRRVLSRDGTEHGGTLVTAAAAGRAVW